MNRTKTALLIGATGFIGRNLAKYLQDKGERVVGTYCHQRPKEASGRHGTFVRCDVLRQNDIKTLIRRYRPDHIYYLAAKSSVRESWHNPWETVKVNLIGGLYFMECLRGLDCRAKVVIMSSCTVYGSSYEGKKSLPETARLSPLDPYSVSKAALDCLGRYHASIFKLPIRIARPVNVTGLGQSTIFSIPNFARQISRMERNPKLRLLQVGRLHVKRDYLDVSDCVKALDLIMKQGETGEAYNISSGRSRSLRQVLDELFRLSCLDRKKVKIRADAALIPKDEISEISLNSSKLRRLTGWKPRARFRQTLEQILDGFRNGHSGQ